MLLFHRQTNHMLLEGLKPQKGWPATHSEGRPSIQDIANAYTQGCLSSRILSFQ